MPMLAGPLSLHMAQHILLMNVVALVVAAVLLRGLTAMPIHRSSWIAAIVQIALLWIWHAPPVMNAAMQDTGLHVTMQASLFVAALWFWSAVLASAKTASWMPILVLLGTSKLFCLLGVLLVFSGHEIYAIGPGHAGHPGAEALADQQLAGLLMLVACPLSYLGAGVVIAARWLTALESKSAA
jgi:putative membrane protein